MAITLTIFGSGTAIPRPDGTASSNLVRVNDESIIIDLGPGALHRLAQAGSSLNQVSQILITHFHNDHTSDLPAFLFATRLPLVLAQRTPLNLIGPVGLEEFYRGLQAAWGRWVILPDDLLHILELANDKISTTTFKNFTLTSAPVDHTPASLAYRIEDHRGTAIIFSGDTSYDSRLVELSRHGDVLVCECSFPDELAGEGHMTPSLAGRVAAEAGVKKLILNHFYPECDGHDLLTPASRVFSGEIILAHDLMELSV
ncbi:MAG: MBL fold metallo-hydrolase [Deltaproteobacteria bacterium]|nr:MBL fold metallo-hydrolase [Deltaproteobacteria bacterium]